MSLYCLYLCFFFFFKQKTAYEMRISDWSSDVCSSDLVAAALDEEAGDAAGAEQREGGVERDMAVGVGRHLRHLDAGLPIGLEAGRLVALVGHQQRRVLGRAPHHGMAEQQPPAATAHHAQRPALHIGRPSGGETGGKYRTTSV